MPLRRACPVSQRYMTSSSRSIRFLGIVLPTCRMSARNADAGPNNRAAALVDEQDLVPTPPLSYMDNSYFDEVYFVQAAEQYLRGTYRPGWQIPG